MYKKEWNWLECAWNILDPQENVIAEVGSKSQADALLSHLNRG